MSRIDYTISEIAEKLNVSRQYIYKKVNQLDNDLKQYTSSRNGVKYISLKGFEIISNSINVNKKVNLVDDNSKLIDFYRQQVEELKKEVETVHKNHDDKIVEIKNNYDNQFNNFQIFHREQIDEIKNSYENQFEHFKKEALEKNKQLESKDKQLESKDKLLENMQVLLKDQKLLLEAKEKKHWWEFWKN
jgi:predicted DNA-binding protein YlxM (UPF0122 family)